MKREWWLPWLLALAGLLLAFSHPGKARGEPDVALLTDLLKYATSATAGHAVPDLPAVRRATPEAMPMGCRRCVAAYTLNVITLREDVDLSQRFGVSILLHEVVHHVQEKTGRFGLIPSCDRNLLREVEAYRTQAMWLEQRGGSMRVPTLFICEDL